MGLFSFLKKTRGDENPSGESGPFFYGDLAHLKGMRTQGGAAQLSAQMPNVDSVDSAVFLSFEGAHKPGWVCRECDTVNSEDYDGCAVCGRKK